MKNIIIIYLLAIVIVSLFFSPILRELPNRNNSANLASQAWQLTFQMPQSPVAEGVFLFHNDLRVILVGILCFVMYVLSYCIYLYNENSIGKVSARYTRLTHFALLEIIWTIRPAVILIIIALPSFALLYSIDEIIEPLRTIKVIGHQWYWSYEYVNPASLVNEFIIDDIETTFDSYLIPKSDLDYKAKVFSGSALKNKCRLKTNLHFRKKEFRLLAVDRYLILPTQMHIRAIITSADVLHSWAIPSLGVKLDACPGRLNQTALLIKRPGIFFGQCSEICGVNHGFRPIGIYGQFFVGLSDFVNSPYERESIIVGIIASTKEI